MKARTSGNWTTDGGNTVVSADSDQLNNGYGICETGGPDQDANAQFISTSPRVFELLEEARRTLEMWKDVAPAVSLCADIDKVIAKAKGLA